MNDHVQMVRNKHGPDGHDRFSCSISAWGFLQELGQTYGWRPQGTTYIAPPNMKIIVAARHDYQPGDVLDYKRLDLEDALAWARALESAKLSPQFALMFNTTAVPDDDPQAQPSRSLVFAFIEYANGGEFAFARAPGQAATP